MKKEFLGKLIDKYFSGNISPEERRELEKWYVSFGKEEGYINKMTDEEKNGLENRLLGKIDEGIKAFEENKKNEAMDNIPNPSSKILQFKQKMHSFYSFSYRVAAILIAGVILAALGFHLFQDKMIIHITAYGQSLQITLPDSSTVFLNGNSSLAYRDSWSTNGPREVFLEGEAFFSVKHKENDQRFLVNTADHFSVEVLGTEFNVKNRKSGTRVVLNSGKVRLNFKQPSGTAQMILKPGELVEFKNIAGDYLKKGVNAEIYSSWKDGKLMLDHTSFREILLMLEESYGLNVKGADKELLDQKISGSMPAENIDTLLKNISVTYGIKIKRKKGAIEIRK